MAIMELINDALRFKDTVFFKESSDLQDRYDALSKLNSEYPNNDILKNEMYCIKKGLDGEKEAEKGIISKEELYELLEVPPDGR